MQLITNFAGESANFKNLTFWGQPPGKKHNSIKLLASLQYKKN